MDFNSLFDLCRWAKTNVSISSGVTLSCKVHNVEMSFHIYNLGDNFDISSFRFSLCYKDGPMQILLFKNLTIPSGFTLIPVYRCKGLLLYGDNLVNNGIISMSARGSVGKGDNIYLYNTSKGLQYVPAVGAAGGPRHGGRANYWGVGWASNGVGRQTGGGSSGSCYSNANYVPTAGAGSAGTSYSGGSGGGAGSFGSATNAASYGGRGGDAYTVNVYNRGYCGVGNPNGSGYNCGPEGTGGLLIIISFKLDNKGRIEANGVDQASQWSSHSYSGGGASGGGSVNILAGTISGVENISARGGYSKLNIKSKVLSFYAGNGTVSIDKYVRLFILKDGEKLLLGDFPF